MKIENIVRIAGDGIAIEFGRGELYVELKIFAQDGVQIAKTILIDPLDAHNFAAFLRLTAEEIWSGSGGIVARAEARDETEKASQS